MPLAMSETHVALLTGSVDGQGNPLSILKAAAENNAARYAY